MPALSVRDGQRCAALADLLVRGLSEQRVRRLLALCVAKAPNLTACPRIGFARCPAVLRFCASKTGSAYSKEWRAAGRRKLGGFLPLLKVLTRGPEASAEAGALLLRRRSRTIWETALRAAPPHAIELTLQNIRLADENDPADSVAWGPAAHVAASPRPWVRLLGLTSGAWPRLGIGDAVLPDHIVPAGQLDPDPVAESDRRAFSVIAGRATGGLVLSRSRRNAQGNRLGGSPLLPAGRKERALARARIPEHAFSESDRLMARPSEANGLDRVKSASQCWRDWHVERTHAA